MNASLHVVLVVASLQDTSSTYKRALDFLLSRPESATAIQCQVVSRDLALGWTEREIIVDTVTVPPWGSATQVPGRRRMTLHYDTAGRVMLGVITEFSTSGEERAVFLSRNRASGLLGEGYVRVSTGGPSLRGQGREPPSAERALAPAEIARFDSLSDVLWLRHCAERAR